MFKKLKSNQLITFSVLFILSFSCIPLFFKFPFRDNIFLTWEGAYRIYNGQMPFKDFGIPLGYTYWLLPALSLRLFGVQLISFVKIQVVINMISGLSFFTILRSVSRNYGLIAVCIVLYVMSFSFYNFWPWYNHSVIVFEFVGLAFLLTAIFKDDWKMSWKIALVLMSSLFCFLSIFTKQDGGAFALLLCGVILLYNTILSKNGWLILAFGLGYLVIGFLFISPLIKHDFGYWFNIGQLPHYSRISEMDFIAAILHKSMFMKLYFLFIIFIIINKISQNAKWYLDKKFTVHLLITLIILFQASILQVTSYVPADGNIYYHSFMMFFILKNINLNINYYKPVHLAVALLLVAFWWSGLYWKYANRLLPQINTKELKSNGVVSQSTFTLKRDTTLLNKSTWRLSNYPEFHKIKLPDETILSMEKIEEWYKSQPNGTKVLNMTELTPLGSILGYESETNIPLWYHLNVAMFDKELKMYQSRIEEDYYDLVLFEYIPQLNNFYPFEVREKLHEEYDLWFSFQAPREKTSEIIEVYRKRNEEN